MMNKRDTLLMRSSCLNKADDNEPVFVLLGRDPIAAQAIRHWASMSGNTHNPDKINNALALADEFETWHDKLNTPETVVATCASNKLRG